jgi:D-glycero-D-manno-heptose 1,7-bisphosphate phosphatase
MKRPAVFFDRDNTLIVSDGYLGDPAQVVLVEGAPDAVAHARRLGYAVVVISNQSGVARGMFSEEDVTAVNARMDELLVAENASAVIDRHEFCPFHPEGSVDVYARESDRRKPKPGMILSAAEKLALDLSRSWVVGDAGRDIEAGKAAGCRTILFHDASMSPSPAAQENSRVEPDYTVTTLREAMEYIEGHPEPDGVAVAPAAAEPVAAGVAAVASSAHEDAAARDEAEPAPAAAPAVKTPRVPKVAIGSRYVPPEGARPATSSPSREEASERAAARRAAFRAVNEPAPDPVEPLDMPSSGAPLRGGDRIESLLEQIALDLRRQHEHRDGDFSVSKLLAGIVQVIVLAILFLAYLKRLDPALSIYLMLALVLQTMTISLLIMSRQK